MMKPASHSFSAMTIKEDAIRNRLKVYQESTEPLITYYRDKGLLRTIDASAAPDAVAESFLSAVKA